MPTLIVLLPPQPRLAAAQAEPAPAAQDLAYALSTDDQRLTGEGRAPVAELPAADTLVAVVPAHAIGWHRIPAPKAPASRLRQALASLLEEALLEDEAELHLALPPQWKAGEPVWVAVLNRHRLRQAIEQLEAGGRTVDRVVPAWPPEGPVAGEVLREGDLVQLAWRDAQGPVCLPLHSPMARALVAAVPDDTRIQWHASPEAAAEAAELAGAAVAARTTAERLLAAAGGEWNLRQFDLGVRRRGHRAAREALRQVLHEPRWRLARLGLLALVAVQLLGANLWAWQQREALAGQKKALTTLLQTSFPQVRAVFDPPAQMRKEIDLLRASAGRPGETDLEPLLQAADAAWPASRGPATGLRYEPGRLTLGSAGWTAPELDAFRQRLLPLGLDAETGPGGVTVQRARSGALPPGPRGAAGGPGPRDGGPADGARPAPPPGAGAAPPAGAMPAPAATAGRPAPPQRPAGPATPSPQVPLGNQVISQ